MKIKYRITLLFTVVVTLILLIVCSSIYYFSDLNRQNDFRKRLRNRALTTANLLLKVRGIDNALLKKIDETTVITFRDKSVVVYDQTDHPLYSYTDSATSVVKADSSILQKVRRKNEYAFTIGSREALALKYQDGKEIYAIVAAAYDKDGLEKLSELQLILAISFFSGILISLVSGILFSSGIVFPIKKITNEVKDISSQNLSRRIALHEPRDELHELANTFNDLLGRLEESFDIQRHFIANASHELSTPLTSISSQLEITLQNERTADEYKAALQSVYEDVRDLTQLNKSLLEIAKANAISEGLKLSLVRVDELLLKLPADLNKINPVFQVQLHFDSFPEDEDGLWVFGNADLLYSAIRNITLNACKYGSDHTAIIALRFAEASIHIDISDHGPGITEEDRKLIFQPFYRTKETSHIPGFGLGLPLALRIITLHKGKIAISTPADGGSCFQVQFPIAKRFHKE